MEDKDGTKPVLGHPPGRGIGEVRSGTASTSRWTAEVLAREGRASGGRYSARVASVASAVWRKIVRRSSFKHMILVRRPREIVYLCG